MYTFFTAYAVLNTIAESLVILTLDTATIAYGSPLNPEKIS